MCMRLNMNLNPKVAMIMNKFSKRKNNNHFMSSWKEKSTLKRTSLISWLYSTIWLAFHFFTPRCLFHYFFLWTGQILTISWQQVMKTVWMLLRHCQTLCIRSSFIIHVLYSWPYTEKSISAMKMEYPSSSDVSKFTFAFHFHFTISSQRWNGFKFYSNQTTNWFVMMEVYKSTSQVLRAMLFTGSWSSL